MTGYVQGTVVSQKKRRKALQVELYVGGSWKLSLCLELRKTLQ